MIPTLKSIFNTNQVTSLINLFTKNVNTLISVKEDVANKQNSLATDITNTKYPTVTAVNSGLATKLSLSGGTMSGAIAMGTSKITGLGTPTDNQDASTKLYVDTLAETKLDDFNTSNNNNDSGNVYSGTLNGQTGTILFTGTINPNDYAVFTVGNNICTTSSRITDLYIITTITGYDISIMNYTPILNEFRVSIKNNSGSPIAGFRLSFRVNN